MLKASYVILSFRFILILLPACLLMIGVAGPLFNAIIGYPSGEIFYKILDPICHQYPTESFWLLGQPMALCARCTGGYFGVLIGASGVSKLMDYFSVLQIYAASITLFLFAIIEALIHLSPYNLWRAFSGFAGGVGSSLALLCVVCAIACAIAATLSTRLRTN